MERDRHPLNLIRHGNLPVLEISIIPGWFEEFEGFAIRIHWVQSFHLLDQGNAPWYDPFTEIPF